MPIIDAASAVSVADTADVGCSAGVGGSGQDGRDGDQNRIFDLSIPRARTPFALLLQAAYGILTQALTIFIKQGTGARTGFSILAGSLRADCVVEMQARHFRIRDSVSRVTYNTVWPLQPNTAVVVRWFMDTFQMSTATLGAMLRDDMVESGKHMLSACRQVLEITGYRELIRSLHERCLGISLAAYGIPGGILDSDEDESDTDDEGIEIVDMLSSENEDPDSV